MKKKSRKDLRHPGEVLREEFLEPAGLTQSAFSATIGWTKARLNELIKGKRSLSPEAALDLSDALGTDPVFWMDLQMRWDLAKAVEQREQRDYAVKPFRRKS